MKRRGWFTQGVLALACLGLVLPQPVVAAPGSASFVPAGQAARPAVIDLALGPGGQLAGQVVDAQGQPQAGTEVTIWQRDQQVASATADAQGRFSAGSLRGGVYQVFAAEGGAVYRCWASNTAPPAAQRSALIVSGTVVRGQDGRVMQFLTNPWVLAGLVGAAIAIPIALSNDDESSS